MAGGFVAAPGGHKIKGGRVTVMRFFLVSVAFTSAWVAVSSQLGYYRQIHGPAVLLQLNIAYFLPSIPLLVLSAFLDKPLEARLGVAKTILVRLLTGMMGYGAVCAWFPFMPEKIWWLLGAVVALGLFSGIAFSAAYQLVARFANKNVIALGLGCSASGPLVLALQLALDMGPTPTRRQQVLLFEIIAVVILGGLWATVSLLVRHWSSIEAHASKATLGGELAEPLLAAAAQSPGREPSTPAAAAEEGDSFFTPAASPARSLSRTPGAPSPEPEPAGEPPTTPGGSGGGQLQLLAATVWKQRSLPPLVAYNSLEPYQTFLSTDVEIGSELHLSWSDSLPTVEEVPAEDGRGRGEAREVPAGRQLSAPPAAPPPVDAEAGRLPGSATPKEPRSPVFVDAEGAPALSPRAGGGGSAAWQAFQLMWAPLAALALSSAIALTLFPLFTYVPTSGLLGESLPKVIFFVRIFADVLGRFLPRLRPLAAQSPFTPLGVAAVKLAGVPLFLLYLKSPPRLHSDVGMVLFVTVIWVLGGYINTMSNMLAPRLVPPQLKGAAAGLMAIGYQAAHFLGLALATLIALLMYGHIGVG